MPVLTDTWIGVRYLPSRAVCCVGRLTHWDFRALGVTPRIIRSRPLLGGWPIVRQRSLRKLAKSFDFPHRSTQNMPENVVELSLHLDRVMCSLCDTPNMRFMNDDEACPRIERLWRSRQIFFRADFLCQYLSS